MGILKILLARAGWLCFVRTHEPAVLVRTAGSCVSTVSLLEEILVYGRGLFSTRTSPPLARGGVTVAAQCRTDPPNRRGSPDFPEKQ